MILWKSDKAEAMMNDFVGLILSHVKNIRVEWKREKETE